MSDYPRLLSEEERFLERARLLAQGDEEQEELHRLFTVAVVRAGTALYGLPVEHLREIVATPPLAPLPDTPTWFLGITQVRGELMSVIHLARWIEGGADVEAPFLAIVEGPEGAIGLTVESVVEFRDIFAEEIAKTFDRSQAASRQPFQATTKDLVTVLDLSRIAGDPRLVIDQISARQTDDKRE